MAEHVTVDVPRRPRDDGVGVGHDLGNGGRKDEPTTGTPAAMASMSTCPNGSAHVEVVREGSTSVSERGQVVRDRLGRHGADSREGAAA